MAVAVSRQLDHSARAEKLAYTYLEAADALGVCERTVWGLVRSGDLRAVRIGRAVRIPVAELERYLAQQTQA